MDIVSEGLTVTDTDPSVPNAHQPPETPTAAREKRGPTWPTLVIIVGLALTLAWSAFLVWALFWTIGLVFG